MDIGAVADELYALPPDQFTSSRNERAKACRASGDRDLAAQVAAMRKPSTAAWVVNQLARHRRDELGQLIELGAAMRAAHLDLKAERLRVLSDQRHRVVAVLAGAGHALAAEQGHAISDAVRQEVEQTLEAALADPAAAQAVSSGRLVSGLSYAGLGDVGAAAAGGVDQGVHGLDVGVEDMGGPGWADERQRPSDERQQRLARQVATAEVAVTAAAGAAEDATRQLAAASEQVRDAVRRHDEAQARVQTLHDELRSAQEQVADAASELRRVQRVRVEASRHAETAAREAARARARLEALREGREHPAAADD